MYKQSSFLTSTVFYSPTNSSLKGLGLSNATSNNPNYVCPFFEVLISMKINFDKAKTTWLKTALIGLKL